MLVLLAACAPTIDGSDQVPDVNLLLTSGQDASVPSDWPEAEAIVDDLRDGRAPGCAGGIAVDGELIWLYGTGEADTSTGRAFTPATPSGWGSVSKTVTALTVLALAEGGAIDLSTPVASYFDDWPASWVKADGSDITIADLAHHTAGFPASTTWSPESSLPGYDAAAAEAEWGVTHAGQHPRIVVDAMIGEDPDHPDVTVVPSDGAEALYSNAGYIVLGGIADAVTQGDLYEGYEQAAWHEIGFADDSLVGTGHLLSMATWSDWRTDDLDDLAVPYIGEAPEDTEAWDEDSVLPGWWGPAGGWTGTIGDLTRLGLAVDLGRAVALDSEDLLWESVPWEFGDETLEYGWGVIGSEIPDLGLRVWHQGDTRGWTAMWAVYPEVAGRPVTAIQCNGDLGEMGDWLDDLARLVDEGEGPAVGHAGSATPPVDMGRLDGRVWGLQRTGATMATPAGFPAALGLVPDLLVAASVPRRGVLSLRLAGGVVEEGAVVQDTTVPVTTLTTSYTNPAFTARVSSATLVVLGTRVPVTSLAMSGTVADRGDTLVDVTLSGTVDVRRLTALAGLSSREMCAWLGDEGGSCERCSDGRPYCVPFAVEDMGGAYGRGTVR